MIFFSYFRRQPHAELSVQIPLISQNTTTKALTPGGRKQEEQELMPSTAQRSPINNKY